MNTKQIKSQCDLIDMEFLDYWFCPDIDLSMDTDIL